MVLYSKLLTQSQLLVHLRHLVFRLALSTISNKSPQSAPILSKSAVQNFRSAWRSKLQTSITRYCNFDTSIGTVCDTIVLWKLCRSPGINRPITTCNGLDTADQTQYWTTSTLTLIFPLSFTDTYIFEAPIKGLQLLLGEFGLSLQLLQTLRLMSHRGQL